jgi:hypothetical protein
LIFEVGFEFFGIFRLGLAENKESHQIWFGWKLWVTVGSAVADECHRRRGEGEEEEEEKKKTRGVRACFVLILVCVFFLKMLRYHLVSRGQITPHFCTNRIVAALLLLIINYMNDTISLLLNLMICMF